MFFEECIISAKGLPQDAKKVADAIVWPNKVVDSQRNSTSKGNRFKKFPLDRDQKEVLCSYCDCSLTVTAVVNLGIEA